MEMEGTPRILPHRPHGEKKTKQQKQNIDSAQLRRPPLTFSTRWFSLRAPKAGPAQRAEPSRAEPSAERLPRPAAASSSSRCASAGRGRKGPGSRSRHPRTSGKSPARRSLELRQDPKRRFHPPRCCSMLEWRRKMLLNA